LVLIAVSWLGGDGSSTKGVDRLQDQETMITGEPSTVHSTGGRRTAVGLSLIAALTAALPVGRVVGPADVAPWLST
jgi:hypothetical protein